jgi:nitrile hydratase beta subunit
MNGIHDMGGMHGFGRVRTEVDEPVFHEDWEAKCLALNIVMGGWRKWTVDVSRHAIERLDPVTYISSTYYERWLEKLINLSLESGLISEEELQSGKPATGSTKQIPPVDAAAIRSLLAKGRPAERAIDRQPRFAAGEVVRTVTDSPAGHTRLPRYARGREGEILRHHGAHAFPDSNAHGKGEAPQHLYAVKFSARMLWGEQGNPKDSVTLDLWESYLEPQS